MPSKKTSGSKGQSTKPQNVVVPDSDFIVFGDGKKEKKKGKKDVKATDDTSEVSKPTVKQMIGGASWTGKLPVNLLSEHCQRQKWNRPDYNVRTLPGRDGAEKMYRSTVSLSRTDPKTRETTKIPPMQLQPDQIELSDRPSLLEAKHFAATYALFRISSMKQIHMALPPQYRDLWRGEFSGFKKDDVTEGRGWKYEEDPFAADAKRQEIQRSIEERKQQQQKQQEKLKAQAEDLTTVVPWHDETAARLWDRSPKVDMGSQIRTDIEQIIRQHVLWNPHKIRVLSMEQEQITTELTQIGFQKSHVVEALEYCKDREEVLEWLMIYVPEQDLPRWAMPMGYNAGVSLVSGDIDKQAKLEKLSRGGFPADACAFYLRQYNGNENHAAKALQANLVPELEQSILESCRSCPEWEEETTALEAIYGSNYTAVSEHECAIDMESDEGFPFIIRFRCPSASYPSMEVPIVTIEAKALPAYVKLSATRQITLYAQQNLVGAAMVYDICQWLGTSLSKIQAHPSKLSDLRSLSSFDDPSAQRASNGKGKHVASPFTSTRKTRIRRRDTRTDEEVLKLYNKRLETADQKQMLSVRQRLPAWSKREQIVAAIAQHQVTIISGETGSGKSTQAVQFILDNAINTGRGTSANIICTQPRRVAALSLADRVSNERCSQVGDEVGYVIRGESRASDKTKITFMTTGVLLRWLQSAEGMSRSLDVISHIFIDEIHERTLDTDFLLALLRDYLRRNSKMKIVLMSATLEASVFVSYFGGLSKVGQVEIEGRTFPVTDLFVDDVLSEIKQGDPITDDQIGKAIRDLGSGISYDLIRDLVDHIDHELGDEKGSILVFLPGTMEIERCLRAINSLPRVFGLPLHASLLPAEQRKVFHAPPTGRRKVVAATNVAETSITIEDVVAVIDTGRVKETSYDPANNMVRLEEIWASQAACKQRRGRAGRVRTGTCYKLFTRTVASNMIPRPIPEIQRVPLEQLCLSVKATGTEKDVASFLSQTLTPPRAEAVTNAIKNLHIMGAMEDNELTALGQYLSMIPADLRCAKLLVYGILFNCVEPCLTIAAILTVKSPFVSPRDKRAEANEARLSFPSKYGDLLVDMAAFDEWVNRSQESRPRDVNDWCSSKFLSQQTLRDIASTRRQLLDSLRDASLLPLDYRSPTSPPSSVTSTSDCLLLRALVAGSLQPQIALIQLPSKKYISAMSGAKELDPEARTIKFMVPEETQIYAMNETRDVNHARLGKLLEKPETSSTIPSTSQSQTKLPPLTRIFIHPSSVLFTSQTFSHHAAYLSYFGKVHTTKPFIRDLTPLNIYSLLLFGGKLEVDTSGLGLVIGGVWRVRGWTRIGVLISRLRALLDKELADAIEAQTTEAERASSLMGSIKNSRLVAVVRKLIELNGQDI